MSPLLKDLNTSTLYDPGPGIPRVSGLNLVSLGMTPPFRSSDVHYSTFCMDYLKDESLEFHLSLFPIVALGSLCFSSIESNM